VVNEALHAGCGVIVTEAVGCHAEFGTWERVRVIPEGDATQLAVATATLASMNRDFSWASAKMSAYSVAAAADGYSKLIDQVAALGKVI